MREVLLVIDAVIAGWEPVPESRELVRPAAIIGASDAMGDLGDDVRVAVVERYASPLGEVYEAIEGLPDTTLLRAEWTQGGPGSSGFDRLSALGLPSGRRAHLEWIFNGQDSEHGSRSAQYLLAGTAGPAGASVDLVFLRVQLGRLTRNGTQRHRAAV
jgi:hypothetical protein